MAIGILRAAISAKSAASASPMPRTASTAKTAMSVCARMRAARATRCCPSSPSSSIPGVSIISTGPSGSSSIALRTGSVVVPGTSETMLKLWPVTAFTRELFPAFRMPNHAMWMRSADTVSCRLIGFLRLVNQNRKSRRLELRMSAMCSVAMVRTFSFGIFLSSSSIMAFPTATVSGDA